MLLDGREFLDVWRVATSQAVLFHNPWPREFAQTSSFIHRLVCAIVHWHGFLETARFENSICFGYPA